MRMLSLVHSAFIALGSMLCLTPLSVQAQGSVGAKYGSREPTQCAQMTAPKKGPPSNAQAAQYLKCGMEIGGTGGTLNLLQEVNVQVAPKGRQYNPRAPIPNVDTTFPIYDIRGNYVKYICSPVYSSNLTGSNVGKSCYSYAHPKAEGVCWKTTFGDWGCTMSDGNGIYSQKSNQAPPQ
jgi:hypothetical protein